MTRNPAGWTVLNQPGTSEGKSKLDQAGHATPSTHLVVRLVHDSAFHYRMTRIKIEQQRVEHSLPFRGETSTEYGVEVGCLTGARRERLPAPIGEFDDLYLPIRGAARTSDRSSFDELILQCHNKTMSNTQSCRDVPLWTRKTSTWTAWCFVGRDEILVSGCPSCAAVLLLYLVRGAVVQG